LKGENLHVAEMEEGKEVFIRARDLEWERDVEVSYLLKPRTYKIRKCK